ncbi:PAS domain S-box protein [Desulfolithobacter sp.]
MIPHLPQPLRSVRTLFLLGMTVLILVLSLPLLYSGIRIMDGLIEQYGMELLAGELQARIAPVERRYETLHRIGLEDSHVHRQEIMDDALRRFASFHYKKTGTLFVIQADGTVLLSSDFHNTQSNDFRKFFSLLQAGKSPVIYRVDGVEKRAVFQYYKPWDSYVGLAMETTELFGHRDLFVRINLAVLILVLAVAVFFTLYLQRTIITPLINLTRFVSRVKAGDYQARPEGRYILEFGKLRDDILAMVATLRARMEESESQIRRIREREEQLSRTLAILQESEQRYKAVYNAPSDAIIIHDPLTGDLLEVNRGAAEMFGYSPAELKTRTVADISQGASPYSMKEAHQWIEQALRQGSVRFEWLGRKKDATLFWLEVSLHATRFGNQDYIISVARDVDARKRAELALAREKEQLAVTLRSIGDGVITTDLKGHVLLLNQVAEKLTGWSEDEARGRPLPEVFTIIDERTGEECENPAAKVLRTGRIVELGNHVILVARDGTRRSVADSAAPIYDPEHKLVGVVVVFRDVTEKYRMEQELLKVKKLESVGVLAGGIAHDFNNILAAILGNISLARARLEAGEDDQVDAAAALLVQAEKATEQARNLATQLLTFSRGGEPVKQTALIPEIIREAAGFILRGSPVQCQFDFAPDLWPAEIDPGQISQVIQNIILNARQAMAEGGQIQVRAENCEACITEKSSLCERCIRIIISDNGPGMPAEVLEKIFDPYFSCRDGGSGLGLAICHSIIDKHGGRISVSSSPGNGTTFTILLPVGDGLVEEQDVETKQSDRPVRPARILLMDDDPMIRELVCQMLGFLGHQVDAVSDGQEAVDRYRQALETDMCYDLVILDLTIPGGMGGQEAAAKLRELDAGVRIIVSSGYSNDPVLAEFQRHGFAAALSKPFNLEEMKRVLHSFGFS